MATIALSPFHETSKSNASTIERWPKIILAVKSSSSDNQLDAPHKQIIVIQGEREYDQKMHIATVLVQAI